MQLFFPIEIARSAFASLVGDPYHILGGKLVAMLITSPEVILAYKERYCRAESVIASSLAARPIVRSPELVFLGTTSLYGTEPTQYTRVSVPADRVGGMKGQSIGYRLLGKTEGYGTLHFSEETADALTTMMSQSGGGRVNYIFGESTSPRLRLIREGLDMPPELSTSPHCRAYNGSLVSPSAHGYSECGAAGTIGS